MTGGWLSRGCAGMDRAVTWVGVLEEGRSGVGVYIGRLSKSGCRWPIYVRCRISGEISIFYWLVSRRDEACLD